VTCPTSRELILDRRVKCLYRVEFNNIKHAENISEFVVINKKSVDIWGWKNFFAKCGINI